MGIVAVITWTCEVCGRAVSDTTDDLSPWSEAEVHSGPESEVQDGVGEWGYVGEWPNQKTACAECVAKATDERNAKPL